MPSTPSLRLSGRVALVTGAASGIGQSIARLLAQEGARVAVTDLDAEKAKDEAASIAAAGGNALGLKLDVTSPDEWKRVVARVGRELGPLRILVNCAGIAVAAPLIHTSPEDWRRVMAVNTDGVFFGIRAGLRAMRRTGQGSIVNIASASGLKATGSAAAYCTSKAAVIMLTRVAALECRQGNLDIRVNAVAPGGVKTPIWETVPVGADIMASEAWNAPRDAPGGQRFAEPDEIARTVLFLVSDDASYISGAVLAVDAAYSA